MASFDFIECAAEGYRFLWYEKPLIFRLAMTPVLIKAVSLGIIIAFGLEENLLRQGLLLLPAYFAEGWLVAQLIRFAVFGEYGPGPLSGNRKKDEECLRSRSRSILGGTIIYTLIMLFLYFLGGLLLMGAKIETAGPKPSEPDAATFMLAMGAIALIIWATFRFLWIYIPVVMDYRISDFLKKAKSYVTTAYMVGTWLLCIMPIALFLYGFSEMYLLFFPEITAETSVTYKYSVAVINAVIQMLTTVVSSVAMAYAIQSIFQEPGDKARL